jgi:NAD(P)-dependent dehydrogenase (short-subunit alcohol dehydrogenase family)
MGMELHGKRALVTGAAKRLGRAIALDLARQGCHIALHYGRSKPEALVTAAEIRALGVDCSLYSADLAKASAVLGLGKKVLAHRLGCQILVNSASVFPRIPLQKAKPADFDGPYAVNLRAPALLTQVLGLAWARKKRPGRIINIADVGGRLAWPGYLPYSLSKAGLLQLTRTSAVALAPYVLVNSVSPGPMQPIDGPGAKAHAKSLTRSLLGRWGGAGEIARAVTFIAQSDFMTGSDVTIDGGRALVG